MKPLTLFTDMSKTTVSLHTFIISLRTLLQAHSKICHKQVCGSTRQTAVLAGTSASLAGLMARPAHATLVWEASRWTPTNTRAGKTMQTNYKVHRCLSPLQTDQKVHNLLTCYKINTLYSHIFLSCYKFQF